MGPACLSLLNLVSDCMGFFPEHLFMMTMSESTKKATLESLPRDVLSLTEPLTRLPPLTTVRECAAAAQYPRPGSDDRRSSCAGWRCRRKSRGQRQQ